MVVPVFHPFPLSIFSWDFCQLNSFFFLWDSCRICWFLKMLFPLNMDNFCLSVNRESELQILSAIPSSLVRAVDVCMALTWLWFRSSISFVWHKAGVQNVCWTYLWLTWELSEMWDNKFLGEWQQSKCTQGWVQYCTQAPLKTGVLGKTLQGQSNPTWWDWISGYEQLIISLINQNFLPRSLCCPLCPGLETAVDLMSHGGQMDIYRRGDGNMAAYSNSSFLRDDFCLTASLSVLVNVCPGNLPVRPSCSLLLKYFTYSLFHVEGNFCCIPKTYVKFCTFYSPWADTQFRTVSIINTGVSCISWNISADGDVIVSLEYSWWFQYIVFLSWPKWKKSK